MPLEKKISDVQTELPRYDWSENDQGVFKMFSYDFEEAKDLMKTAVRAGEKPWKFLSLKRRYMLKTSELPATAVLKEVDDAVFKLLIKVNAPNQLCIPSSIVVCIFTSYTLSHHN